MTSFMGVPEKNQPLMFKPMGGLTIRGLNTIRWVNIRLPSALASSSRYFGGRMSGNFWI
jgi:hypothetical protein